MNVWLFTYSRLIWMNEWTNEWIDHLGLLGIMDDLMKELDENEWMDWSRFLGIMDDWMEQLDEYERMK